MKNKYSVSLSILYYMIQEKEEQLDLIPIADTIVSLISVDEFNPIFLFFLECGKSNKLCG